MFGILKYKLLCIISFGISIFPTLDPNKDEEKAVGIVENKPFEDVVLRNWLTFVLRQAVANAERECYHTPRDSLHTIRKTFRKILQDEVSLALTKLMMGVTISRIDYFSRAHRSSKKAILTSVRFSHFASRF